MCFLLAETSGWAVIGGKGPCARRLAYVQRWKADSTSDATCQVLGGPVEGDQAGMNEKNKQFVGDLLFGHNTKDAQGVRAHALHTLSHPYAPLQPYRQRISPTQLLACLCGMSS